MCKYIVEFRICYVDSEMVLLAVSPPPKGKKPENGINGGGSDIFSSDPFFASSDPFGMPDFGSSGNPTNKPIVPVSINGNGTQYMNGNNLKNNNSSQQNFNGFGFDAFQTHSNPLQKPQAIDNALQILDKRIEEMKNGFSRGILNDDFPLEMLDPLRQSS